MYAEPIACISSSTGRNTRTKFGSVATVHSKERTVILMMGLGNDSKALPSSYFNYFAAPASISLVFLAGSPFCQRFFNVVRTNLAREKEIATSASGLPSTGFMKFRITRVFCLHNFWGNLL